jgi:hypothetical protein
MCPVQAIKYKNASCVINFALKILSNFLLRGSTAMITKCQNVRERPDCVLVFQCFKHFRRRLVSSFLKLDFNKFKVQKLHIPV